MKRRTLWIWVLVVGATVVGANLLPKSSPGQHVVRSHFYDVVRPPVALR